MAGFGSLVPGMAPMPIPQMKSNGLQGQGMSILKAALGQAAKGAAGGGAPGTPAVGTSAGPGMPMQIAPPAAGGAPPGLLGALMAKLSGGMGGGMGGGAPMGDMGGAGPGPNVLSGMW